MFRQQTKKEQCAQNFLLSSNIWTSATAPIVKESSVGNTFHDSTRSTHEASIINQLHLALLRASHGSKRLRHTNKNLSLPNLAPNPVH